LVNKRLIIALFLTLALSKVNAQAILKDLPKPKNGNIYVIAHRGAHNGIPENTLAAYQKAIDLGCDYIEIDVRKTKDGKFVSVHNETIDAYVEGITGKVKDFTLAELKQMNIGKRVGPEWENERIPTFEEILKLSRGKIGVYLDLKEPDVEPLIDMIKKYGMETDIVWYIPASYMKVIKKVIKYCNTCIVMPDTGNVNNIVQVVNMVNPRIIASDMSQLSENFVKIAHENNAKVFTDDNKATLEEWKKIINWDTDGIQTDQPKKLIEFLNKN